jgi:tRNA threonylcarbamoyl adenosine modification protein (Sua5/YciO/YrdC/YwlC family)
MSGGAVDLDAVVGAVRRGEVIGLPTDTVYGVGADPFSEDAVARLFSVKGRPEIKPIPILAADLDALATVVRVDGRLRAAADRFWPGGLTVIARRARGVPAWIGSDDSDTVGVRVPDHPAALAVLSAFGPMAVTSANRSGEPPAADHSEAEAALGDSVSVYVPGTGGGGPPSTVVDLSGDAPRVVRQGAVDWSE